MQPLHSHFGYPSLSAKRSFCWLVDPSRTLKIRDLSVLRRCHQSFPPLTKFLVHLKRSLGPALHVSISISHFHQPISISISNFHLIFLLQQHQKLGPSPQNSSPSVASCRQRYYITAYHPPSPFLLPINKKRDHCSATTTFYPVAPPPPTFLPPFQIYSSFPK
jgi:hypothetical protein